MWNSKNYKKFDSDDARKYAEMTRNVFAPIYPVIAGQIMDRCKVRKGPCIDIGSGPANLAIAIAKISNLKTYAMDFSWYIGEIAKANIRAEGLERRVAPVLGDVHRMPFRSDYASLVVSRGSMRFWKNKPMSFREIFRVLKPGGKGYVGGGVGSAALSDQIDREMLRQGRDWKKGPMKKYKKTDEKSFRETLRKAGIERFEIINDDTGFWIYLEKGV